ncbi:microtubule/calcium-binding protein [Tothia fuscella]|uniref:Translationally-controlled tumor protein homolog n=1 Tax=Tothia fuscella TaxID=1048955 RepID=A0A9P4NTS8_9PEZI|nr:microtubule/calcium-binding protein [Tothia fuscella]
MIIYKDILTDDEIISDSYDLKEVDGAVYEADGRKITVGNDNIDIGANPSAEDGGDDAVEDTSATVLDIAHSFRLQETQFDKKGYLTYLKGYMKKVKEAMKAKGADEAEVKDFESKAGAYAKKIIANFKDYEFLIGESMDPDGMVILLNYREDGTTPYVTVWKHGLIEMKV